MHCVVTVGGCAGSGKIEFSRRLARLTGWALVDKDSTTQPVVETALRSAGESPNDRKGNFYRSALPPAEYQALWDTTYENVTCGNSAIMVAPFTSELRDPPGASTLQQNSGKSVQQCTRCGCVAIRPACVRASFRGLRLGMRASSLAGSSTPPHWI
jgi:hypothetical protein